MIEPIDWPVNLATQRIAEAFLERFRTAVDEKTPRGNRYNPEREVLKQLCRAIRTPYSRHMLDRWLQFRFDATSDKLKPAVSKIMDQLRQVDLECAISCPNPDATGIFCPRMPGQLEGLHALIKELLGVTVIRPINSNAEAPGSSLYYASIHHPLLDDDTKRTVINSVIFPPGAGSVGAAILLPQSGVCSPDSFGERTGVVEWQDLVLGQVSMLVAHVQRKKGETSRADGCNWIVVSAFLPLPCIFENDGPSFDRVTRPDAFVGILRESVGSVGEDLICSLCDAQEDRRHRAHIAKVLLPEHTSAQGREAVSDPFVRGIVEQLAPSSFLDRPGPLQAVAALVPRPLDSGVTLAHVSLSKTIVETALKLHLPQDLGTYFLGDLSPEEVIVSTFPESQTTLAEDLRCRDFHSMLDLFSNYGVQEHQVHRLFSTDRHGFQRLTALWVIHTRTGKGWPSLLGKEFQPVELAFNSMRNILNNVTGWEGSQPQKLLTNKDSGIRVDWRHRYAQYKLRSNVLTSFFDLLSMVLCSKEPEEAMRLSLQVEYILKTVLSFPLSNDQKKEVLNERMEEEKEERAAEKDACDIAEKISAWLAKTRLVLLNELGADILGTSACVLLSGQVHISSDDDPVYQKMLEDYIQIGLVSREMSVKLDPADAEIFPGKHPREVRTGIDLFEEYRSSHSTESTSNSKVLRRYEVEMKDGTVAAGHYTIPDHLNCTAYLDEKSIPYLENGLLGKIKKESQIEQVRRQLIKWTGCTFDPLSPVEDCQPCLLGSFRKGNQNLRDADFKPVEAFFRSTILYRKDKEDLDIELGKASRSRFMAHEAMGSLNLIWRDKGRYGMSDEAQFALWTHRELLIQSLGRIKSDPMESLTTPDEGAWGHLSPLKLFGLVTRAALLHSAERAIMPPSPLLSEVDKASRAKIIPNVKARYFGSNEDEGVCEEERIQNLEKDLGISIETLRPLGCDWLDYRGFVLCYFNCLWPAAYHAILAHFLGLSETPLLSIAFDPHRPAHFLTIKNRYVGQGRIVTKPGSDERFLRDLIRSLNYTFDIVYPESATHYITEVKFIGKR